MHTNKWGLCPEIAGIRGIFRTFLAAALYREGRGRGRLRAPSSTHQEAADAKHSPAQGFTGNSTKFQYFLKIGDLLREGNFCSQKFPSLHGAATKNVRRSRWKKFQRWIRVKARSRTWTEWRKKLRYVGSMARSSGREAFINISGPSRRSGFFSSPFPQWPQDRGATASEDCSPWRPCPCQPQNTPARHRQRRSGILY